MMKQRVGSLPNTLKPIRENKVPVNNTLKPETIANLGLRSKSIGNHNRVLKDYYNNKQKINNDLSRLISPVRSSQIRTDVRVVETVKNVPRRMSSEAKNEHIRKAYLPAIKYSPPNSPKARDSKSPTGIKGHYYSRSLVAANSNSQRYPKSTKSSISMSMESPQLKSYVLTLDTNINGPGVQSASFFSDKTTVSNITNTKKSNTKRTVPPKTNVVIKRIANKSMTGSPSKTPANRSPSNGAGRRSPNQSLERLPKNIYGNKLAQGTKKVIMTKAGLKPFY